MKSRTLKRHLIELINQLEVQVFEPLFDQQHVNNGHWDYVAYGIPEFLAHMREAHALLGPDKKFLDVGCGIGTKVHLASYFFDAYGIELQPDYAAAARKLMRRKFFFKHGRYKVQAKKQRIFETDALNFDYSDYDVIYFFRPMNKDSMQIQLEKRIYEQAKPGAIIIPIFAVSTFPNNIKKLPTPSKKLRVKGGGNAKAMIEAAKLLSSGRRS